MEKYPNFWHVILGNAPAGTFLGYLTFAIVAALASIIYNLSKRDVDSPNTPQKLSFLFWVAHNLGRAIGNLLCIPLAIRILLEWQSANPLLLLVLAIAIGFSIDRLFLMFKDMGVFTTQKLADKVKARVDEIK